MTKIYNFLISHNHNSWYKETKYSIEPNINYIRLIWINIIRNTNIIYNKDTLRSG